MEGKRRQKGERLIVTKNGWNQRVKSEVSFHKKGEVRNRRQKFLKVGQKFINRRD